jgi:hypothetical protein
LLIREVEVRGIVGYKIGDEVFEVRELWEGSDVYLYNFQLLFLRALCIFLPELHLAYSARDVVL